MLNVIPGAVNEGAACVDVAVIAGLRYVVRNPAATLRLTARQAYACGAAVNVLSSELRMLQAIQVGEPVKGLRCSQDGTVRELFCFGRASCGRRLPCCTGRASACLRQPSPRTAAAFERGLMTKKIILFFTIINICRSRSRTCGRSCARCSPRSSRASSRGTRCTASFLLAATASSSGSPR